MGEDMTLMECYVSMNDSQHYLLYYLVGHARSTGRNYIAGVNEEMSTIGDCRGVGKLDGVKQHELRMIYSTLDENQKLLVDTMVDTAIKTHKKMKEMGYDVI